MKGNLSLNFKDKFKTNKNQTEIFLEKHKTNKKKVISEKKEENVQLTLT